MGQMSGWIAVDLDGTLAQYGGWKGPDHIGEPVPLMLERVKKWIAEGKEVRIFTARACIPDQIPPVRDWLRNNGLPYLMVTNVKDFAMIELWDDRCIQVRMNTGEIVGEE
jgi:hydroxymethylpyrimidine pyrophosphatase-like HAD family hydrolase